MGSTVSGTLQKKPRLWKLPSLWRVLSRDGIIGIIMRSALSLAVGVALFTGPALTASADVGDWSATVTPGFSIPSGNPGSDGEFQSQNGPSFNIRTTVSYELEPDGWVGMELGYSTGHRFQGVMSSRDLDGDGLLDNASFDSDIKTSVLHLTPYIRIGAPLASFMTYNLAIGAGIYSFFKDAGTATLTGRGTTGTDLSSTKIPFAGSINSFFGLNIGQSLTYEVVESFELGLDVSYHLLFMPGDLAGIVMPGARMVYSF